ncbi:winged helix-turn-helix transcriptional regulator [Sphingobacterium sp. MYb388]|uniref:winged helix-turn-helix transcriptional regulator n=1 Tax=Sphingobacterium sp. MYb388 TaxID=2745437 RepID=UPI0030A3E182
MKEKKGTTNYKECVHNLYPLRDAIEVLGPKWRIQILIAITYGNESFTAIQKALETISPRILSKELKTLEENKLIIREVSHTYPIAIRYKWTEHTKTIVPLITFLKDWGQTHRDYIFK